MEETLFLQLHKISDISPISEAILETVLESLWKSRKTGLKTQEKSSIQSLLNLPSSQQIDPVLACLRLLIRKYVHENLNGDDLLKLFPPGLSPDLQNVLILLLAKYQRQWKEEASTDQTTWQRPSSSHVQYGVTPSTPYSAMDTSSMWPRQHYPSTRLNHNDNQSATPIVADANVSVAAPVLFKRVDGPDNLGILPRLKSMTWTMQNQKSRPTDRVSVISLKLHDYTKSPSGEREVKFQLNRDTLEAMLTSMTYISDQLNNAGGPSSKRPRV